MNATNEDIETTTKAKRQTPAKTAIVTYMDQDYEVTIGAGSIRLRGSYANHVNGPQPFDISFRIGDRAEYDSYNLVYVGTIVAIGQKTVTIDPGHGERKRRLSIGDFAWRNWDFDAEKIAKRNADEFMCI